MTQHTHLQVLVEEAENVHVVQLIVPQPIPQLAVVAGFDAAHLVATALLLELLGGGPPEELLQPARRQEGLVSESLTAPRHGGWKSTRKACVRSEGPVHLRPGEFKDVVEGLFEKHDDGHLNEEVGEAAARVTL